MVSYQSILLPDGRKLAYREFGIPDGFPVFYFHGSPSSSLEPLLIGDKEFSQHGFRIIAPDRPGIGESDFQENRKFSDWPKDISALADKLNIDKFAVFGNSAGCGYVLACSAFISDRLTSAVVVSGGWQMNLPEAKKNLKFPYSMFWILADNFPFLIPFLLNTMKGKPDEPREKSLAQAKKMMPAPDYEVLTQNNRVESLTLIMNEALKNKKGAVHDIRMYLKPLNINLPEIQFPISFFHGAEDKNLPIELVKKQVAEIPDARLFIFEKEAHLSTLCNYFDEAAQALLNQDPAGKTENETRYINSR
jgi:pimeloyl-ACP methyl ester carboxylesterase